MCKGQAERTSPLSLPFCKTNPLLSLLQRWPNDAEHIFLPERRSRLVRRQLRALGDHRRVLQHRECGRMPRAGGGRKGSSSHFGETRRNATTLFSLLLLAPLNCLALAGVGAGNFF